MNVTFQYKKNRFPYQDALVDTGSDFVLLPFNIAEAIGAEPDFDDHTELNCACGDVIKAYGSRYPVEIIIDHAGFRPSNWQTHVRLVDANIVPLLGHRGFLNRFDATFYGKKHIMKLEESK
ncbi:MAG: retroviral-like aspartic protease family protein [Kiritimatiellales bacterium]|nr:retroviral-like aspartic protease family protein [Kiritimatiellales bacterium]